MIRVTKSGELSVTVGHVYSSDCGEVILLTIDGPLNMSHNLLKLSQSEGGGFRVVLSLYAKTASIMVKGTRNLTEGKLAYSSGGRLNLYLFAPPTPNSAKLDFRAEYIT